MPETEKVEKFEAQLREAILKSGKSLNTIWHESGVSVAPMSRFLRGERTLTLKTFARLCRYFDLDIVLTPGRPPSPASGMDVAAGA